MSWSRPSFVICVILWWPLANPSCIPNLNSLALAVAEILKGNRKILGSSLHQSHAYFSSTWDFMMGLGKPQRRAKIEVAGFIYYENIREFVYKNCDKPKWGIPLLFGETDFTDGFLDPMFPIRCATVVRLRLQQMGDFYERPHFIMENFTFREAVKWRLKIFAPD